MAAGVITLPSGKSNNRRYEKRRPNVQKITEDRYDETI